MDTERHSRFAKIYSENQAGVYGYIYSLVPRASDAEEVFGQVTVVLWEKWDQFDQDTNFRAWARRIAYNVAMNYLRRHQRREQYLSDAAIEQLAEEAETDDHWLRLRALAKCVDRLLPDQQKLVEMCYLAGAPVQVVAKKLGKTTAAVYKKLSRIRRNLHDCVEQSVAEEDL